MKYIMDKTIGIIGGGQLCKMILESVSNWNIKFNVLETDGGPSILGGLPNKILRGSLMDSRKIRALAKEADVITYEIETVNVDELMALEAEGKQVYPQPHILLTVQDKGLQKMFYQGNGIPTPSFIIVDRKDVISTVSKYSGEKVVIKPCLGGYDGRGVLITYVDDIDSINDFLNNTSSDKYLIEEFVDCDKELSIVVARDQMGNSVCYPTVEMVFNDANCLDYQLCPADIPITVNLNAIKLAKSVVDQFKGIGIFAIEMFLAKDGSIYVNEMAPRVHNSGHHTIEACYTSQFQQLVRILLGYPLGSVNTVGKSIMINLLGPKNYVGSYTVDNTDYLMRLDKTYLHLYNKTPSKPGRKLGHITIFGETYDELIIKKDMIVDKVKIIPTNKLCEISPKVGVIMGSSSDYPVMVEACSILSEFGIPYEKRVISAHRTPDIMWDYAKTATDRGLSVIIAGAGGAAHLPGMTASMTTLPVIGVPIKTSTLSGVDSLYSIVQMPRGVPVATVAINGAKNAGLIAIKMLATEDPNLQAKLVDYKNKLEFMVADMDNDINS